MAKITLGDIFQGNFKISQVFGVNPAYYAQFGLKGHEGVDFACPIGTPIVAPFDGIVLRQDIQNDYQAYGKVVVLWDPIQMCAVWFCHLSEEYENNGQKVTKGTILGKTGNTGNTEGPHLHFGLVLTDKYGNRLNPNNGFFGFINSMDPAIVNWNVNLTPSVQTIEDKVKTIIWSGDNAVEKVAKLQALFPN